MHVEEFLILFEARRFAQKLLVVEDMRAASLENLVRFLSNPQVVFEHIIYITILLHLCQLNDLF